MSTRDVQLVRVRRATALLTASFSNLALILS